MFLKIGRYEDTCDLLLLNQYVDHLDDQIQALLELVKTVPRQLTLGTNLNADERLRVETLSEEFIRLN